MKKLIVLLFASLTAGWIQAQLRLTGKVKDTRGHIMAGASVAITKEERKVIFASSLGTILEW